MQARFTPPDSPTPDVMQGVYSLTEGTDYVILEVLSRNNGSLFRIEASGYDSALFDGRAFTVTSRSLPPTWRYFQFESGNLALRPEPWNLPGFWESYYERDPRTVEIYEREKTKIITSSRVEHY